MPDDGKLTAALDAALQQLSAKGTLAELYLRYFPVSFY
jgi:polar amino acid transport system substrate-binding protein